MRALEFLVELFDKVAPFRWTKSTPVQCSARFTVDGVVYFVEFHTNNGKDWDVGFVAKTRTVLPARGMRKSRTIVQQTYMLTGTGNQYLVFSTVMKMMEDFLKEYKPNSLKWNADKAEESRISLYGSMLGRFKRKLNAIGYDVAPASDTNRDFADFAIVRKSNEPS
jgi:hypothetical protein